jgi:hypothetical protein
MTLETANDRELADRCYAAAFEGHPTEPLILWERARNLQELGQTEGARRLIGEIDEGPGRNGNEVIQKWAREEMEGR